MASIQRSLSSTERTLRALEKKIAGGSAGPQASGDGQNTTVR
jgi:hypothetical protein